MKKASEKVTHRNLLLQTTFRFLNVDFERVSASWVLIIYGIIMNPMNKVALERFSTL